MKDLFLDLVAPFANSFCSSVLMIELLFFIKNEDIDRYTFTNISIIAFFLTLIKYVIIGAVVLFQ